MLADNLIRERQVRIVHCSKQVPLFSTLRTIGEFSTCRQQMYTALAVCLLCVTASSELVKKKCDEPNNRSESILGNCSEGNARCCCSDSAATMKRTNLRHPSAKSTWAHASWDATCRDSTTFVSARSSSSSSLPSVW